VAALLSLAAWKSAKDRALVNVALVVSALELVALAVVLAMSFA
jgi:hypothetical protein